MSMIKTIKDVFSYYLTIIIKYIFIQKEIIKLFFKINNFLNKKIFGGIFVNYSFKYKIINSFMLIKILRKKEENFL